MKIVEKIKAFLKKDVCKDCLYYIKANGTCQSKKCGSSEPYVSWSDRHFCSPYKGDKCES